MYVVRLTAGAEGCAGSQQQSCTVASLMLRLSDCGLLQSLVPIQFSQFTKAEIYVGRPPCLST